MPTPSRQTRTIIERCFEKIDPSVIGPIYCDEGGEEFFETVRPRIVEDGIAWGEALATRLERLTEPAVSLYVGAGIAELPALLTEALDLERKVVVTNLREEECEHLNGALRRADVGPSTLKFRARDASDLDFVDTVSHVAIVSVLTDPETYPINSGLSYGRLAPVQLDTAAFEREREAIRKLVTGALGHLAAPGLITTTGEEAPWLLDWIAREKKSVSFEPDDIAIASAVVGDPIGFFRVREDS